MANTGFGSVGHLGWCHRGMLSPDLWACYSYSGGVAGPGSKRHHTDQMCFKFIDQAEVLPIAMELWQFRKLSPLFLKRKQIEDKELPSSLSLTNQNLALFLWTLFCNLMMAYMQMQRQMLMLAYKFDLLHHSFCKTSLIHFTVSRSLTTWRKSFNSSPSNLLYL